MENMHERVKTRWHGWLTVSDLVLYIYKESEAKLKGKVCKTVLRPAMMTLFLARIWVWTGIEMKSRTCYLAVSGVLLSGLEKIESYEMLRWPGCVLRRHRWFMLGVKT